jgi:hypothetical protein
VGILVVLYEAPDGRRYRGQLVIREVNCRHGPGYNRRRFVQQGEGEGQEPGFPATLMGEIVLGRIANFGRLFHASNR